MSSTKKINIFLFSLLAIVCSISIALASTSQNITGWAQSTNIGWIKLNNCTDTANPGTCESGGDYGLNTTVPLTKTGKTTISGYAWSPNIGWVIFGTGSCPTAPCTAQLDWDTGKITGWARACSVYASGCSGALNDPSGIDAYRGGWDGFIALSPTSGSSWGLSVDTSSGAISGYAWGSEIIGWVQFAGNIKIEPTKICPDGTLALQSATCTCTGGQIYQQATNTCTCPTGTTLQNGQCTAPVPCTGGTVVSGQCVCPIGTTLAGNACVPIVCPVGQTLQGNICVPVVCGARQMIDPKDPTGTTCICTDGSAIPTTGPNTGICPKKAPKYIES